jgi:hypothetical protein
MQYVNCCDAIKSHRPNNTSVRVYFCLLQVLVAERQLSVSITVFPLFHRACGDQGRHSGQKRLPSFATIGQLGLKMEKKFIPNL